MILRGSLLNSRPVRVSASASWCHEFITSVSPEKMCHWQSVKMFVTINFSPLYTWKYITRGRYRGDEWKYKHAVKLSRLVVATVMWLEFKVSRWSIFWFDSLAFGKSKVLGEIREIRLTNEAWLLTIWEDKWLLGWQWSEVVIWSPFEPMNS